MHRTNLDTLWDCDKMALAINPKQNKNSHGVVQCGDLSKKTCQRIIDEHKNEIHLNVKGRIQKNNKYSLDKKRDVDVWVIDESATWIDEIIINSTYTALQYLDYDVVGLLERPQLLRYTSPSEGYDWHTDLGEEEASTRKISLSIALNNQYEGGNIAFFSNKLFEHKMPLGQSLAFPSFLSHRVMPITKGERWALVSWISGHPFR
jgi:PKHD-type hydroxylase|tara:strand:+ start:7047 stop:7661 length:615 start_codon:yes stop_codon:yes gene_type:complete